MSHEDAGRLVLVLAGLLGMAANVTMFLNRDRSGSPYAWPRRPAALRPTRATKVLLVLAGPALLVAGVLMFA